MTVMDHLRELRKRLVLSMLGMIPGAIVGWLFAPELLNAFLVPFSDAMRQHGYEPVIHFPNPMDQLVAYLKIALVSGLFVGVPWLAWQGWAFIAPALYEQEKRYAIPFVLASSIFFTGGAYFGFSVVFPLAFEMLLGLGGDLGDVIVKPTIMINEYLSFATRMLIAFGVVFEIPVVVTVLAAAQVVNWKQLLDFGRWWVVIAAVLSAILTPPDVGSMMLMIVPLVVLYFLSVGVAYFVGPKVTDEDEDEGHA